MVKFVKFAKLALSFSLMLIVNLGFGQEKTYETYEFNRFNGPMFDPVRHSSWLEPCDLDGDGDTDFVSSSRNIVSAIANNGDARFEVVSTYDLGAGTHVKDLVAGDFDGDGDTDVVVLDFGVTFLANNGSGGFSFAGGNAIGGNPEEFVAADVDGDSDLDLVLSFLFNERIEVWINDGNGSFAFSNSYESSLAPWGVVAGDLNGDSNADIVFADLYFDSVGVMYGNGDGTFEDAIGLAVGSNAPYSVALGDIDNDADLDIVTGNVGGVVGLLRNDGNGEFQSIGSYVCGGRPEDIRLADLNGDQFNEIIVSSIDNNAVLYNNGDESFNTVVHNDHSRGGLAVADFDLDGDLDFAVPTGSVYLNRGNGLFGTRDCYPLDHDPIAMVSGDFDGDGLPDIAVATSISNCVGIFLSDCDGKLRPPRFFYAGNNPQGLAIGDLNGDGDADLVTTNGAGEKVFVLLNFGGGSFPHAIEYELFGGGDSVSIGDMDADGMPDVVVSGGDRITMLLNSGNGMLQNPYTIGAPDGAFEATIGDLDGDGLNEVVVNGFSGAVSVFQNLGGLAFNVAPIFQSMDEFTTTELVDIDGDEDLDIGLSHGDVLEMMLNNGDGTFVSTNAFNTGYSITKTIFGNADDDQLADAIVIHPEGRVSVLPSNGDGSFGPRTSYAVGQLPIDLVAADFDGDQRMDISVLNNAEPWTGVSLLLQNSELPRTFGRPDTMELFRGLQGSGTIEDVLQSDDSRLAVRPGFVLNNMEAPVWLVFESTLASEFNSLDLKVESNAGTPGLTSTIEVWNWVTESYEVAGNFDASFNSDVVDTVSFSGELDEYVQAGCGRVRARVGWRRTGFTINFPWEVRVDQVQWDAK